MFVDSVKASSLLTKRHYVCKLGGFCNVLRIHRTTSLNFIDLEIIDHQFKCCDKERLHSQRKLPIVICIILSILKNRRTN